MRQVAEAAEGCVGGAETFEDVLSSYEPLAATVSYGEVAVVAAPIAGCVAGEVSAAYIGVNVIRPPGYSG